GTGADAPTFSISASPNTATVSAGHPANYKITVTPANGHVTSTVSLSCSDLPTNVTCSLSPSSLAPGASPVSSTLTITKTSSAGMNVPYKSPMSIRPAYLWNWILACLVLLAFPVMARAQYRGRLIGGAFGMTLICALAVFQISCATVNSAPSI